MSKPSMTQAATNEKDFLNIQEVKSFSGFVVAHNIIDGKLIV